jgi:hypothetical protein
MQTISSPRMFRKVALVATVGSLLFALFFAAPAMAEFGIAPGTLTAGTYQGDGTTPETQAGATPPFASSDFEFNTVIAEGEAGPQRIPDGNVKEIVADLPPGLLGDPQATPQCPRATINNTENFVPCPVATQVGTIEVFTNTGLTENDDLVPVYNMVPREGEVASLAFAILGFGVVHIEAHLRSESDYGVQLRIPNISTFLPAVSSTLHLWGNPADESHNAERGKSCAPLYGFCFNEPPEPIGNGQNPVAFVRNPAVCDGTSPVTSFQFESWQEPGVTKPYSVVSPPVTGCEKLSFSPTVSIAPETSRADSATGLGVELKIPQQTNPQLLATPPLRDVTVRLPEGLNVDPSSAAGLAACSPAQIGLTGTGFPEPNPIHFSAAPATCPDGAKLGSVEIETPVLDHPLQGSVYLAQPEQNPFGGLLALYLVVEDPRTGIVVKLPGKVEADEGTGRLTATFQDNPQLPFEELHLHFFGGAGAPLRTPPSCGGYAVGSELTSWASPTVEGSSGPFTISSGPGGSACPTDQLQPKLTAGLENPVAAAHSPLVIDLTRPDGTQRLDKLDVQLPSGLTASLKGVPYCPDAVLASIPTTIGSGAAQLANPSCPAGSRIGSVSVGVGTGNPYYVKTGSAYLAGPYKGAPLSLAIVTPAVAGPFDLGNVVVRSALRVNPETTQITAESDPIPTILHGIPLDIRDIRVAIDRSNFALAPTDCAEKQVSATVGGEQGASATVTDRFQVADCAALPFKPKLKISLKGSTKRAGHPALKAVVSYPEGTSANISRAQVGLPHSEFLDQGNLNNVCTQAELKSQTCPAKSIYGKAKAWTPLLDKPLEGPVYLAVGFGYKLPALVAELNGQIRVLLKGKIDTDAQNGIRNTFEAVPDAPVSRFVLELKGGPKYGLLENSENICKKAQQATARFTGQNGAVDGYKLKIANSCKGKSKQ